jgi:hypothetical protein
MDILVKIWKMILVMIAPTLKTVVCVRGYVKMMDSLLVGIIPVRTILLIAPKRIVRKREVLKAGFPMVIVIVVIIIVTVTGMVEIAVAQHVWCRILIVWEVERDHMEPVIMNVLTQMEMMIAALIIPVHLLAKEMGKLPVGILPVQIQKRIALKLPVQTQIAGII